MQLQKLSKTMLMVVLAAITTKSRAQERHEFSVKQSVDYAVKNSVQVKNALLDVQIQEQNAGISLANCRRQPLTANPVRAKDEEA